MFASREREVQLGPTPLSTSSATAAASTAGFTSWTRTMWAPRRMLATIAASEP